MNLSKCPLKNGNLVIILVWLWVLCYQQYNFVRILTSYCKQTSIWQVNYALGALYYLCSASNKEEILKPEVVDIIKRYASAGAVSVSFSNMAQAFLDKHVSELNQA